jgi:thioredoxin reductase (NADPH)
VAVVGGGNSAAEESLFVANMAQHVTLLVRGDQLKASQMIQEQVLRRPEIDVRFNTEVTRFDGSGGKLKAVTIRDNRTGSTEVISPAGVFVFIGLPPQHGLPQTRPTAPRPLGLCLHRPRPGA